MNGYLAGSNVLSELTRATAAPQVEAFLRQSKDRVFVSVFSIGEIRKGIGSLPASNRRAALEDWLNSEILPWLGKRILPVTLTIAERWGEVSAPLKAKGRARPVVDAIMAATAFRHDLILVTRNVADHENLGITILNPWESVWTTAFLVLCVPQLHFGARSDRGAEEWVPVSGAGNRTPLWPGRRGRGPRSGWHPERTCGRRNRRSCRDRESIACRWVHSPCVPVR